MTLPIKTKKAILAFYLAYDPNFDQTLCEYMKRHDQMDLIGYRGRGATKYEAGLRKQVEYYQRKLKNAEYLRKELARNGFNTCAGKEFDQQATPTSSPSSPQSPSTPSPPSSPSSPPPPSTPTSPPDSPENQSESCQPEKPKNDQNRNLNGNQNKNENQNGNQNEYQNENQECKFLFC